MGKGPSESSAEDGDLYGYLLRQHFLPTFGHRPISGIREPAILARRHALLISGISAITVAKAYRLLKPS